MSASTIFSGVFVDNNMLQSGAASSVDCGRGGAAPLWNKQNTLGASMNMQTTTRTGVGLGKGYTGILERYNGVN